MNITHLTTPPIPLKSKFKPNGVAGLDDEGKLDSDQWPQSPITRRWYPPFPQTATGVGPPHQLNNEQGTVSFTGPETSLRISFLPSEHSTCYEWIGTGESAVIHTIVPIHENWVGWAQGGIAQSFRVTCGTRGGGSIFFLPDGTLSNPVLLATSPEGTTTDHVVTVPVPIVDDPIIYERHRPGGGVALSFMLSNTSASSVCRLISLDQDYDQFFT